MTYIVTQKVTPTENVNKSISRERIIGFEQQPSNKFLLSTFCDACYVHFVVVYTVRTRHERPHTAVFRACLHGRVPCTRASVYRVHGHGHVYGKCTRPFIAVSPCMDRVHGR